MLLKAGLLEWKARGDQSELKRDWQDSKHPVRCLVGLMEVPIKRSGKKRSLGFMLKILWLKTALNKGTFLSE